MGKRRDAVTALGILALLSLIVLLQWPGEILTDIADRISRGFLFMVSATSFALVVLLFTIEHFRPARPEKRGFHPLIVFDAIYLFIQLPIVAILVAVIASPIQDLLERYTSWLVLDFGGALQTPLLLILGVALSDLPLWFSHLIRHQVPFPVALPHDSSQSDSYESVHGKSRSSRALEFEVRQHHLLGPSLPVPASR